MIARALIDEVRCQLREGRLSQRKIADSLGISRGTVNAILREVAHAKSVSREAILVTLK